MMMQDQFINKTINDYTFIIKLGGGQFGTVYEAINLQNSNSVAIKTIQKKSMLFNPKLSELLQTQIKVLRTCNNQNVLKYINNFQTEQYRFIVTELLDGQDLEKYLKKKKRLSEDQSVTYLKQIMNGFKGLHQVYAMHRDLKLANIVLHKGVCKIIDLGFAKIMKNLDVTRTKLGSSYNMAPEILKNHAYGMEADIWSIGVIFYQMIYGDYPYKGFDEKDLLERIEKSKPNFEKINISAQCKDFIQQCLTIDPFERISWQDMYNHPLIKKINILYNPSNLDIEQNIIFYKKMLQKSKILNVSKMPKKSIIFKPAKNTIEINHNQVMQKNKLIKQIEQKIEQFQRIYLGKRNNYMFIFKFITPYFNIQQLKIDHSLPLYILSKNAYHKMKRLYTDFSKKNNVYGLNPHWQNFVKSQNYKLLQNHLLSETNITKSQLLAYKDAMNFNDYNQNIRNQSDIEKISNPQWNQLVKFYIKSYKFQLMSKLLQYNGKMKECIIRVVKALDFIERNPNQNPVNFVEQMQVIDFQKAGIELQKTFKSILQNC